MKIFVFALLVVFTGSMLTSEKGPHGGLVHKVDHYAIEVKRDNAHFYTYLLDEANKTVVAENLTCEMKSGLSDGTALEISGTRYGLDGHTFDFSGEGNSKFQITYSLEGKPLSVVIETENTPVQE